MNQLTPQLLAQIFAQESTDPFLFLLTLSHADFSEDIFLVNNSQPITSRGQEFLSFPFRLKLAADDGETSREMGIEFDNVSLELITGIRTVTTAIDVKLEMILASMPDTVQMSVEDLKINNVSYNKTKVTAKLYLDTFITTEMTSERYLPTNFPGLF